MISREEYIRESIESNLFWLRIMKEHAIFMESAFAPVDKNLALEADRFKKQFENLLSQVIKLANGSVSKEALLAGQFITRYTDESERITQQFTGININRSLTMAETNIEPYTPYINESVKKEQDVSNLNRNIIAQLNSLIRYKVNVFNSRASCRIFTFLYTSLYEHLIHEAREYLEILTRLQSRQSIGMVDKNFWNHIMSDHAKVIRGMLDPTEDKLFNEADRFVKIYNNIIDNERDLMPPNEDDLAAAKALSEFKSSATRGIIECKIKSIIIPLLADHVLREANHYIYLLEK